MTPNKTSSSIIARQTIENLLSHWKFILVCLIIALGLGYLKLRYSSNLYSAQATIRIQDEKESKKLPSLEKLSSGGLFTDGDKIKDEMEIIKSRSLITNVVKTLNLNIKCFAEGSVKEREIYRNPPLSLNFFDSDTIVANKSGKIYIKIKSSSKFVLFENDNKSLMSERDDKDGKLCAFGEKITSSFGDIVITPNVGKNAPVVGSSYQLTVTPITYVVSSYQFLIKLSTEKGSSVVKLDLTDTDPYKAIDILNELIDQYNTDVKTDKEEVVRITSDFINNRLEKVAKELGSVETQAEEIQKKNRLVSLNSQADINLQSKKQLEDQIVNTSTNLQLISYLQEELNDDDKLNDMLPADIGIGDGNTALIIKSHNELVAQRDKILKNSTEKNPVVIELNNQISTLKQNLQNSLVSLKKTSELTLSNLNNESNRISSQLYVAPTKARQLRGIERQKNIKESLYLYLLEKREESAIRLGMYTSSAKIIDRAFSSYRPVAPNHMFVYLASIIFGIGFPIGLLYVRDIIDTKIYTKADLQEFLDIPLIGDIPKSSKKQKLIKRVDYSPKAEAFRILRSNIDFLLSDTDQGIAKKIFITSTKAQEGKSHTSTNLANSISFSDKKVLLIEMDIRVPKIIKYLGIDIDPEKGLTDYIVDTKLKPNQVILNHPENKFLDILPSGTIPPNPSELLMNSRVSDVFNYANKKYDYIIVDTSAVGLVSDTLLISKYADMFVYVVSANGVDKRQLVHVAQTLYEENRLPNMTMLLNGVKSGKKGYGYGYGYGNNPHKKKKWYQFSKS